MLKEMKRYLSAIESLDEADRHLTTNLINYDLVHVSDDFRKIVQDYHSVTNDVSIFFPPKKINFPPKKMKKKMIYIIQIFSLFLFLSEYRWEKVYKK